MSLVKQLATAQGRIIEIGDELEAVATVAEKEKRDLTETDRASMKALTDEHGTLVENVTTYQSAITARNMIASARINKDLADDQVTVVGGQQGESLPAVARLQKSKHFKNNMDAYNSGKWVLGRILGHAPSIAYCTEKGIGDFNPATKARNDMETPTDTLGGFLVPDPLAATIIELLEQFGVYRRDSRNVTMTSGTLKVPRLDGSLTVYYPDEGAALTESDLTLGQVLLTAIKYAQLAKLSTELNEDSVISMIDLLTRDIARNFAHEEDINGFVGRPATPQIDGIGPSLNAGAKVINGTAGWANVTLQDFEMLIGKLKQYPGLDPTWYMSRYAYFNVIIDLLIAAGGTDMRQVEEGGRLMFLGAPVQFTQVLPSETVAFDDLMVVCGDLDLGTYFGNRRAVSIRTLTELYAATDQLGVMATERAAINVHSVGDATEAGCITGLYEAAA